MLLADYYDDKLTGGALDLAAVQGMVTSLNGGKPDGPNAILDPRSMAELTDDLKGELVGIGAQIDYDETTGMALVMGTLPASSAAGAGLQKGDRVLGGRRATVPGTVADGSDARHPREGGDLGAGQPAAGIDGGGEDHGPQAAGAALGGTPDGR